MLIMHHVWDDHIANRAIQGGRLTQHIHPQHLPYLFSNLSQDIVSP